MPEFACDRPITIDIRVMAGLVDLVAEDRTTASVEVTPHDRSDASREAAAATHVDLQGDVLVVHAPKDAGWLWRRGPRLRVTARVPVDTAVSLGVASADAHCQGRYRAASITTASGDITVDEVTGAANANTASGDIEIRAVGGPVRVTSASGDVSLGRVDGAATVTTASGDVRIGDVNSDVTLRTASGDLDIRAAHRGQCQVKSASGDVAIGVAQGVGVWLDVSSLSGSTRSDLTVGEAPTDRGADLTLSIRTLSGDVEITRAAAAAAKTL